MDYRGTTRRPEWNVHFTDNADAIGKNGFQYGHPDQYGVHLTTYKRDRQKEPGFNFAFPADARDAKNAEREQKYGDEAVLFYGNGMDVDHFGDEERQRIFWGPNIDKRMIFPIQRDDEQGGWAVFDDTGRALVRGKDYNDVVRWVQTNYRMLQSIREKQLRQRLHRQREHQRTQ
jgi:hypothetical protein